MHNVMCNLVTAADALRHRDGGLTERYDNEHTLGGYWGHTPGYAPPAVGVNCLLYLQDMTLASGPLRVSPGSHLGLPSTPKDDARWEEQVEGAAPTVALACRAGDLVMTCAPLLALLCNVDVQHAAAASRHDELLHSGSFNTSSRARMYMSTKLCRVGQPHRDDFSIEPVSIIPLRSHHHRRCHHRRSGFRRPVCVSDPAAAARGEACRGRSGDALLRGRGWTGDGTGRGGGGVAAALARGGRRPAVSVRMLLELVVSSWQLGVNRGFRLHKT